MLTDTLGVGVVVGEADWTNAPVAAFHIDALERGTADTGTGRTLVNVCNDKQQQQYVVVVVVM